MSASIAPLTQKDTDALRELLAKDVPHNLYLLGILEEYGIEPAPHHPPFCFYGRMIAGNLTAALFVGGQGGLLLPSASDGFSIRPIARQLTGTFEPRTCLGERAVVDVLTQQLSGRRAKLSLATRLFSVSADDLGPFTNPALRLAEARDLPELVPMAAAAIEETLGIDPLSEQADAFKQRVEKRIAGKRTYVFEEGGRLVFKIDVGSRSPFGAELEGMYTLPSERRNGHATLCLGQLSRHLLSSLPRLALRVPDEEGPVSAAARRVGYLPGRPQRLVIFQ